MKNHFAKQVPLSRGLRLLRIDPLVLEADDSAEIDMHRCDCVKLYLTPIAYKPVVLLLVKSLTISREDFFLMLTFSYLNSNQYGQIGLKET